MNDQPGFKITSICVAKPGNSTAITCAPRRDLGYFEAHLDSPRLNQSFLNISADYGPV